MKYYLRLLPFVLFFRSIAAQATSDPSDMSSPTIVQQTYAYNPSEVAASVFAGVYAIMTSILLHRLYPNRTWWGVYLPMGTAVMSTGFVLRVVMVTHPNIFAVLVCSELCILLSPAAFVAFNYVLYGRFVVNCIERRHSLIRPERTARYFVLSDISTFCIQGSGGYFITSTKPHLNKIGVYIILVGMSLQTISFGLYFFLVYHAYRSLKKSGVRPFEEKWGIIMKLLFFSSTFFFLRCVYRTVELAESLGKGYLTRHEAFLYAFDPLPLLIALVPYTIFWPSEYFPPVPVIHQKAEKDSEEQSTIADSDSWSITIECKVDICRDRFANVRAKIKLP